jgi:hypothetical protein
MQKHLHSLITLADFKAILGFDDREDALSRFCLVTATYALESYCRRGLLIHKYFERLENTGERVYPLREYPVREVLAVYAHRLFEEPELVEPELYEMEPGRDVPVELRLSPALGRQRGVAAFRVIYRAGYAPGKVRPPYGVPADLGSACLELAAWNMARYRGRRIGVTGASTGWAGSTGSPTGATRGAGTGEHLESSMPENVRWLLEGYVRKTI